MDRETILSLGEAYNQCYTLTEQEQQEVDLINEKINALGPAAAVGAGVWDYHDLRKQGFTHAEAIAKALLAAGVGTLGTIGGGALGSVAGPVGSFAGGVGGGMAGYEGGNLLYDKLTGRVRGTVKDKDGNDMTVSKVPGQTATLNGKQVKWGKQGGWEPVETETTTTDTETSTTEVKPDPEKLSDLKQGKDQNPVATAAGMYKDQAKAKEKQQQPEAKPQDDKSGGNLTPMQQWAKNFPKLAAKVKPGSAGYDEIQAMNKSTPEPKQTQSQTNKITGVKSATKNMVKNTQKLNQGSKNMKTDIKTPGVRALSKTKDYSDTMNKATNNTKKAFAPIPEEITWEEELLIYMIENDIYEITGRQMYLDEGLGKLLRRALPAVKAGFKRVKEGGKWVLKKVKKGGGDDAADKVKDAVKTKTRKAKGGLLDKDGKPLKVTETKPVKKPSKVKSKDRVDAPKPDAPKAKPSGKGKSGLIKKVATGATVAGAGGFAGHQLYKHLNKDKSSDSKETTSSTTSKPETKPTPKPETKPEVKSPTSSGPKTTPSSQTTPNPKQRSKNKSKWNRPTGRLEMRNANIARTRREDLMLDAMTDSLFEGLPEPKVNYLKDMDPYDPRRAPRDHAPGSPLPPASMRPGLPPRGLVKKNTKKKDTKTA